MANQVLVYDTTLRDGTQGEAVNFTSNDKLRVARKLDEFGVHYIEGGWPGSNPKDIEFFSARTSGPAPDPRPPGGFWQHLQGRHGRGRR